MFRCLCSDLKKNNESSLPFALTPSPLCPALWEVLTQKNLLQKNDLARLFAEKFKFSDFFLYGSGKESIFRLLQAIKSLNQNKDYILLSAYTCPEIAAAAVRAGFKIALLDFYPDSLRLNYETIPVDGKFIAAVILSNLYGIADDYSVTSELSKKFGFYIIDDAGQGIFSKDISANVGFRGDFGIFSFARGKCLSGVSAGALTINRKDILAYDEIKSYLDKIPSEEASIFDELRDLFYGVAISLIGLPYFYWITQYLPFLGLGATNCDIYFKIKSPTEISKKYLEIQLANFSALKSSARKLAESWSLYLSELDIVDLYKNENEKPRVENILLRYPILVKQYLKRDLIVKKLFKYGLSASYPSTLDSFAALRNHLIYKDISNARNIAKSIVTLPVHSYVEESVQEKVGKEIKKILC